MKTLIVLLMLAATSAQANICQEEWPNDFQMQEHCTRKQSEGIESVSRFLQKNGYQLQPWDEFLDALHKGVAESDTAAIIMWQCLKEWPNDWRMISWCIRRQAESARSLGRSVN